MKVFGVEVQELGGQYLYVKGPYADQTANVCKCTECDKWVPPMFKGVPGDPESYIYPQCDTCLEAVHLNDVCGFEEDGKVCCAGCYQAQAMKRIQ